MRRSVSTRPNWRRWANQQIDIENDLEFMAGDVGFDEDDMEGDDEEAAGEDGATASKDAKRQKKLAKAVFDKKVRNKKINLTFESAELETEKQLN